MVPANRNKVIEKVSEFKGELLKLCQLPPNNY